MPTGTGVVDAFKNLIRHGKHHHQNNHQQPPPQQPAQSPIKEQQQQSPPPHQQRAERRSEDHHASPTKERTRQEPQQVPQAVTTPESPSAQAAHREAVEKIVREEREAQEKMPTYKGLENFKLLEKMGDGAFSNVYKAIDLTSGQKIAVKAVRKLELNAHQRSNILKEVQIMRGTRHPSIVKLISFSESPEHYFIVLELMEGGELFHQIVKLTYFSESLSRHVILQVAHGIRYLHEERGVVHRDIKPENLLFERIPIIPSKNPTQRPYDEEKEDEGEFTPGVGGGGIGRVKIADFGLSKVVWNEETMTPCGTVGYTAPEIVKDERYSKSVDMWALGCVLYTLLCGFPPFYDESINVLTEKVARGYYTFLSPWWDDISATAKDLITHLLCVDPAQRYTIDEFLAHPWCNAAPAPPPPPTPYIYGNNPVSAGLHSAPLDSPLLTAARGGRAEGRSPGLAILKEAFDVTYAVHRMEEEGARRRKYKGRGGAGARGFLQGLNEDDEDDEEEQERLATRSAAVQGSMAANQASLGNRKGNLSAGYENHPPATNRRAPKGFELDMDGSTLLGRRHKRGGVSASSPLAGKPFSPANNASSRMPDETSGLDPGSPMQVN